jgi:hypothetical protein
MRFEQMKPCLFCYNEDIGLSNPCKPPEGTDFVCSSCVILLSGLKQEFLKQALELAIGKNIPGKIQVLKMFIEPKEVVNVRPAEKRLKRNHDRAGSVRPDRFKKGIVGSTS